MKPKFYLLLLLFASTKIMAQIPEEALRLSWFTQSGTARNQAIGGAMASLGGDATANLVNPAGLAFFKTSDFVITPGLQMGNLQSDYRGTNLKGENRNKFMLGTSGFVFGGLGDNGRNSFALTITQRAGFNRPVNYKGQNDYSSFGEPLGDEFANSNLTIDQALNSYDISLTTKMALYTYLVDTATVNGSPRVIVRSETPSLLNQEYTSKSTGGTTEITLGFGHELNRKWMVGGSLGIPITVVNRDIYFRESDATGNTNNNFNYLAYREKYKISGVGLNLRAGVIYRPKEYVRLGLAFHSPDIMNLTEKYDAGFAADLEGLFSPNSGYDSVSAATVNNGAIPDAKYSLYTPARIMISGSYVFREIQDTKKQRAFITADLEYVNYKWNRFGAQDEETQDSKNYYRSFNDAIKASYKGAFNFKLGGELKFNILMARLGFAYYGSPYKDNALRSSKMNLSGGLGYRDKGIFIDLSYVYRINKDVNFPYRLNAPRANTFASLKDNGGSVFLTFGCKI